MLISTKFDALFSTESDFSVLDSKGDDALLSLSHAAAPETMRGFDPAAAKTADGPMPFPDDPIDLTPDSPGAYGEGFTSPAATGDQNIDALLYRAWDSTNLTYSFPTAASNYTSASGGYGVGNDNGETATFGALNAAQISAARDIFQMYENLTGLSFTEITETDTTHAIYRLAESEAPSTAWGYYPSNVEPGGDVWFNPDDYNAPSLGTYAFHTTIHEIGHASGLKHGQETSVYGAMTADRDSMEFSIMTYRAYVGHDLSAYPYYTVSEGNYAQTLMMYDIAALQYMYGADFGYNSGDTTYTFNTATGEMSVDGVGAGTPTENVIFRTIWDGDGVDTYDFSNYTTNMAIDLAPGGWVDVDADGDTQSAWINRYGDQSFDTHARGQVFNALQFEGDSRSLIENAIGGTGDDFIAGNTADNTLSGGDGNDTIYGLDGGDTLYGATGQDDLFGGAGNDSLFGGEDQDVLHGDAGDDILYGGESTVDGLDANDTVYGDGGDDRLFGGQGDDAVYGGDDDLFGGAGDDILYGADGNDMLDGGAGIDTADYSGSAGVVTVNLMTGSASRAAIGNDTLVDIENITGSDANGGPSAGDLLTGNNNANVIDGGDGINTIYGLGGDDTLYGGTSLDQIDGGDGDDVIYGASSLDTLRGGAGNDSLFGGNDSDDLFGGAGNDSLFGGAGGDTLNGGSGADVLDGGDGVDEADYSASASGVSVNLATGGTSGGDAQGDTLISIENLTGSAQKDYLYGDAADNLLKGGAGDDILRGAGGRDTLYGGGGADNIKGGGGADSLYGDAGADRLFGQGGSDLLFGGSGDDKILGNGNDDTLYGDAGADLLSGGFGEDVLRGGAGTDLISGGGDNDRLFGGTDNDRVFGSSGDDILYGDAGSDTLNGNSGADTLYGGDGGDRLNGSTGNDILFGGAGSDILLGGDGSDTVFGGTGFDVLSGDAGADSLYGDAGDDRLKGGAGDDVINGGAGVDRLFGESGADTFQFTDTADSTAAATDLIADFESGADQIDLSAIDADTGTGGDQAFSFIGASAFSSTAGELRVAIVGGHSVVQGDVNGDGNADFEVNVFGDAPLETDFIL